MTVARTEPVSSLENGLSFAHIGSPTGRAYLIILFPQTIDIMDIAQVFREPGIRLLEDDLVSLFDLIYVDTFNIEVNVKFEDDIRSKS